MPLSSRNRQLSKERRAMYSFGDYNPYRPSVREWPLVEENLERVKSGAINLRGFLRQTPNFARWQEEHLRQARVLMVTNEPGLGGIGKLYGDLVRKQDAESVADLFHESMLSWLSLSNHPGLKAIHGELPWVENGSWQAEHPRLAACGKAGYFLVPGEEAELAGCKVLHLELSPFAQSDGQDVNPRNDQDLEYHQQNLEAIRQFCSFASPERPRDIFIVGNRARIRSRDPGTFQLQAIRTSRKDRSHKIVDLLRVAQAGEGSVRVRLCRQWPAQGREPEVLELVRATAFELRPARRA
ncbi:hypothetical protein DESUT3_41100 [Desulfuromonas versatilis]|uniref:Uncharacterized protein n=1 Tax=Desulfuromonas versatilis TaxID=2802975 RepID=A0ABM8HYC2_9BACT|nr:hypothetical protein [Desulfuromonas versatilis]BCR07041.1 hypothetical protein DESUT3_41100 [Desulfuromonas versatilis]